MSQDRGVARERGRTAGDRLARKASKGERQRRAILDAQNELLASRSITDLAVGEVAQAAGVSRSAYYFYFDSKFAALAVATREAWDDLIVDVGGFRRGDDEEPREYLRRLGTASVASWIRHDAVLIASVQAIPLDATIAQLWSEWNARLADLLTEQIVRDAAEGIAQPVVEDVPSLVSDLHVMTQHLIYQDRLSKPAPAQTKNMLSAVVAIWLASAYGSFPT